MLNVNESSNINGNITVTDENNKAASVLLTSCSLNSSATNLVLSINIVNKDLLSANLDAVQAQLNDYKNQVLDKMKTLGYQITL